MDLVMQAHRAAEAAARESYGRLIAYLSARSRDLAAAEDALGEAFRAALETWPRDGVPEKPEAWLLAVARRRMIDDARHERVKTDATPVLRLAAERRQSASGTGDDEVFPDERLKLMFVCAHPSIDAGARAPLMLQTVLGLDAARIASAFLVAPATMGQRLVRAKARIREAGIPFEVPGPDDLPARLDPVLHAIYAAFGAGWDDAAGVDPRRRGLAVEAIWLARILVKLVPEEPEARGLLSLLLHCEARRAARRSPDGDYIALSDQDATLWDRPMINEAERELCAAAERRAIGRFQLEAAIQSSHAQRAFSGSTDWEAIALLYQGLSQLSPSVGALVGRAAALANARGLASGLAALEAIDSRSVVTYQPYWAVRAHLLGGLGRTEAARESYSQAIGLCEDPAVREFLIRTRNRVDAGLDLSPDRAD
jgi:RNA polymerase sigma-70 factor (ECF subfamily)